MAAHELGSRHLAGGGSGTHGSAMGERVGPSSVHIRASVVVVGAGLAGLVAADSLTRAMAKQGGVPHGDTGVVVLEACPAVGGRMRTVVEDDGFAADLGATWYVLGM